MSCNSDSAHIFNEDVLERIQSVYESGNSPNQLIWWFRNPPKYTTVRVNFPKNVRVALHDLQAIVDEVYKSRNQCPPVIYMHHVLSDLLIIPPAKSKESNNILCKEVVVDVHCGAAVLRGADIFVPGILAAPADLRAGDAVTVYADLAGKCLKGFIKTFSGPKMYLGNGVATCSRHELFSVNAKATGVAVQMRETVNNCPSLSSSVLGSSMFLQNLPSVLCSHVLNPSSSDLVLDMCASPGGKTTHLASIMQNSGVIIALDKTKPRVEKLKSNVELSGYTNVHSFAFDSTKAVDPNVPHRDLKEALCKGSSVVPCPPYAVGTFDCVLLDAPCSALGQRPQLANKLTTKELDAYPQLQKKLLAAAVQLLKPGGSLVYSTCSVSLEENENVVSWVLDKYPDVRLDSQNPRMGGPGRPVSGLSLDDLGKLQRFDICSPGQAEDGDTIGFFIAKFKKSAG